MMGWHAPEDDGLVSLRPEQQQAKMDACSKSFMDLGLGKGKSIKDVTPLVFPFVANNPANFPIEHVKDGDADLESKTNEVSDDDDDEDAGNLAATSIFGSLLAGVQENATQKKAVAKAKQAAGGHFP